LKVISHGHTFCRDWDVFNSKLTPALNRRLDRAGDRVGVGVLTGLALMERSVEAFPIALAYRNLAVYWNSEGNATKTDYYVRKALELEPNDSYNLVFAAGFMVANGHGDEALKIAKEHEDMLPASYNLAAIYAQLGQSDKALAMLKRHFFDYERNQASLENGGKLPESLVAILGSSKLRHWSYVNDVVWSPDGNRIAYNCDVGICLKNANGLGEAEQIYAGTNFTSQWSPDGRYIIFLRRGVKTRLDMYALSMTGR
jgi:tetratricopeptide (TPR) repeat protein